MIVFIKIILQLVFVVLVLAALSWPALERAVRIFLADTIGSYGAVLLGTSFSVLPPEVDYRERSIRWSEWKIPYLNGSDTAAPLVLISSITVHLPTDFLLDWRSAGLLPSLVQIKSIVLDGVTVSYDIDREGESLSKLKNKIASASELAMRDRLNAAAKSEGSAQSFVIDEVRLNGVVIDASSKLVSGKSRLINAKQIGLHGVGVKELGLDAAEVLDRIYKNLMDTIRQEVVSHGLVEVKSVVAQPNSTIKRKPDTAVETRNLKKPKEKNSGEEKMNAVGRGLKKAGQTIGQGFKKLFN